MIILYNEAISFSDNLLSEFEVELHTSNAKIWITTEEFTQTLQSNALIVPFVPVIYFFDSVPLKLSL